MGQIASRFGMVEIGNRSGTGKSNHPEGVFPVSTKVSIAN
jgi:hypothetical protein